MTENEAFIYESIENQVRMGFLSLEEIKDNILEEIEDNEFENEISEDWAINQIETEWQSRFDESKTWEHPTDTDRLITAFDDLCDNNIIALHNAGYTTSDGEYEVVEVERELRKHNIVSDGYCFYHEQDLSRAIAKEDPSLYIAFQKVDNDIYRTTNIIWDTIDGLKCKIKYPIISNSLLNIVLKFIKKKIKAVEAITIPICFTPNFCVGIPIGLLSASTKSLFF